MMNALLGKGTALLLSSAALFSSGLWIGYRLTRDHYQGVIARIEQHHAAERQKLSEAAARTQLAQANVVTQVEVRYRDRIKVVKEKGDAIIKEVPVYVTQQDNARFGVNVGFVRSYNAAFTGQPAGRAAESDREPASIPLTAIAEVNAFNAGVCRQWKEQALGWRDFYQQLQKTVFAAQ